MRSALDPATAIRAAIEAMDGTLVMARALVEGGRRIDLAGLEQEAGRLCAAVITLDVAEAKPLRPALEALRRQVDGLSASLGRD
jgi:hypothetical protein